MKLVYKGKFNGDVESLPHGEHMPEAVKFKEFDDPKKLAIVMNVVALVVTVALIIVIHNFAYGKLIDINPLGFLLSLLTLFPHELLHAICFKETVYLYTNLSQGMLFVTGPEPMTKARFIFMSMLPNIVFGFIPFLLFFMFPNSITGVLGVMGATCIGMGAGDYYNVFNAITQMPKGAKTYIYGFSSYWFIPKTEE